MTAQAERSLTVDEWLRAARESAQARGLAELLPLLENLATAMRTVRDADWCGDEAASGVPPPKS
jgi:hypothetical protein